MFHRHKAKVWKQRKRKGSEEALVKLFTKQKLANSVHV